MARTAPDLLPEWVDMVLVPAGLRRGAAMQPGMRLRNRFAAQIEQQGAHAARAAIDAQRQLIAHHGGWGRVSAQRFAHEVEPVLAEEHLFADKKAWRTEHPPRHSFFGARD